MKEKRYSKESIIPLYKKSIKNRLNDLKENDCSESIIYKKLAEEYAVIISTITEQRPDITLEELKPITKIFTDYQAEYFKD